MEQHTIIIQVLPIPTQLIQFKPKNPSLRVYVIDVMQRLLCLSTLCHPTGKCTVRVSWYPHCLSGGWDGLVGYVIFYETRIILLNRNSPTPTQCEAGWPPNWVEPTPPSHPAPLPPQDIIKHVLLWFYHVPFLWKGHGHHTPLRWQGGGGDA